MRLSFALIPLLSVVRASSYDSESSEVVEAMSDSPLRCFVTNEATGTVALEICRNPDTETQFVNNRHPACMMIRTRKGKTLHSCIVLPALSAADCDVSRCIQNKKTYFSECCCLSSGCNENMIPRVEQ